MFLKNKVKYSIFGLFLIFVLATACTPESICLSNQNAMQTGFYSAYSKSKKDTLLTNFSVVGLGLNDSVYSKESVQKLFLPLSFDSDITAFILENNTFKDTLWVKHSKELYYISRKCGYAFNFKIDTVWFTSAFIDSAYVETKTVRYNENVENVEIFIY